MTPKRFVLILLTAFVILKTLLSLSGSLAEPQVQSRLDLYQSDLILQATAGEFEAARAPLRDALLGADPYATVDEKYGRARTEAMATRDRILTRLQELTPVAVEVDGDEAAADKAAGSRGQLDAVRQDLEAFVAEIDLKHGWLQMARGERGAALADWEAASAAQIPLFSPGGGDFSGALARPPASVTRCQQWDRAVFARLVPGSRLEALVRSNRANGSAAVAGG